MLKICTKCRIKKDINKFGKLKSNKDGLQNQCKECIAFRTKKSNEKIRSEGRYYVKIKSKPCSICKQIKTPLDFDKHKYKLDGLSSSCKVCNREKGRLNYNKNYKKDTSTTKRSYHYDTTLSAQEIKNLTHYILIWAKKIKAINYLKSCCKDCGEDDIFVLEFHHKNPKEKEYNFSNIRDYSWEKIKKELLKCELLCSTCHSDRHYNLKQVKEIKHKINKEVFLKYKNISSCERCDKAMKNNSNYDFHHKDPTTKVFSLSNVNSRHHFGKDLPNKITDELDKCIVLCKNCHIKEHLDVDKFEKYKEEIYKKINNEISHRKYTDQDCEKVKHMFNVLGIQKSIISKELNIPRSTVHDIVNR